MRRIGGPPRALELAVTVEGLDHHLKQALAGDQHALTRVLVAHSPRLTSRISQRLSNAPSQDFSVEDVLQNVFVDVIRGIGGFHEEDQPAFTAWLNRVADNRLNQMFRERGRKKRGGDFKRKQAARSNGLSSSIHDLVTALSDTREGTPSEYAQRDDLVAAIHKELAELPDAQREAIATYYLDERSLDSTANAMKTTPGAVRGLLQRARARMRRALGTTSGWFSRR